MMHKELNIDKHEISKIKRHLMFLNFNTIFGFFFFCGGLIGTIIIYSSYNRASFILNWQDTLSVEGIILELNKTRYGYGDETSDNPVYEYKYQYRVNDSVYLSNDYSTGIKYHPGDKLVVTVQSYDFNLSRINGLRKSPFGLLALTVILLPIAGLFLMIRGLKLGITKGEVLSRGILTVGKYFKSIETNQEQNDEKLFKHIITFSDINGKKHITSFSSIKSKLNQDIELVYDKTNPENTYIFDSEIILWEGEIINYCRQHTV